MEAVEVAEDLDAEIVQALKVDISQDLIRNYICFVLVICL